MTPSPTLLEAQARLMALRRELGITKRATASSASSIMQEEAQRPLPSHLGWHSATLTQHLQARQPSTEAQFDTSPHLCEEPPNPQPLPFSTKQSSSHIRLYPTLAMAILKGELVAPARVWLLCKLLDEVGCGWMALTAVRHAFTCPQSEYRLCGKRQLRNLLHAGEGIFWQREGERLWLRSVQKVASELAVPRLTGLPIKLPVQTLLGSMQTVRAHFYASFHSGRTESPIARETLTAVSGLSADSQRRYEKVADIQTITNYAIGKYATQENKEVTYGRYGHAAFALTDQKGKQGTAGKTYMAWQLPNSYRAIHLTTHKGNQRRINSQLADLSMKGMTENGRWQP